MGLAAHTLGGEGTLAGIVCAGIALASMLGGKALSYHLAIGKYVAEEVLPDAYEELKTDAAAYEKVNGNDELRSFLIDRGFTEAENAAAVSDEDINLFNSDWSKRLEEFNTKQIGFEEWKDGPSAAQIRQGVTAAVPLTEGVADSLGPIDLIFGFLGISTAFKMAMAEQEDDLPEQPIA